MHFIASEDVQVNFYTIFWNWHHW